MKNSKLEASKMSLIENVYGKVFFYVLHKPHKLPKNYCLAIDDGDSESTVVLSLREIKALIKKLETLVAIIELRVTKK